MSSDVPTPMTAAVEKDCRPLHWIELIALRSNLRRKKSESKRVRLWGGVETSLGPHRSNGMGRVA
jgi:hypothetical protein